MLDIPFYFGYNRHFSKYRFGGEIGLSMNLHFSPEGKILSRSNSVTTIQSESKIYKDKLGWSYNANVFIGRDLWNGTSLNLKLGYTRFLNNINLDDYEVETKLTLINLEVGLRKLF